MSIENHQRRQKKEGKEWENRRSIESTTNEKPSGDWLTDLTVLLVSLFLSKNLLPLLLQLQHHHLWLCVDDGDEDYAFAFIVDWLISISFHFDSQRIWRRQAGSFFLYFFNLLLLLCIYFLIITNNYNSHNHRIAKRRKSSLFLFFS